MGLINWLISGGNAAEKAIDAAIATGDKLVYTDEEKADAAKEVRSWVLQYLQATNPQNAARRIIAFLLVATYIGIIALACIAGAFDSSKTSYAEWLFGVIDNLLTTPVGVIIAFYFATGTVRAWQSGGAK